MVPCHPDAFYMTINYIGLIELQSYGGFVSGYDNVYRSISCIAGSGWLGGSAWGNATTIVPNSRI